MVNQKKNGAWVLTRLHNDYDQQGDYFEAAWAIKPTLEQLAKYFGHNQCETATGNSYDTIHFLENLHNGGGRLSQEDIWFELDFVEFQS